MSSQRQLKRCDQCQLVRINGVVCHEIGCPNMGKQWENGEWVRYLTCWICGCEVREGDVCGCQDWEGDDCGCPEEEDFHAEAD